MTIAEDQEHGQDLLLPPRARLIHIGLPKSGSSTIQEAAQSMRRELRGAGVLYPGKKVNQSRPAGWLLGEPIPFTADPGPRREWWDSARKEIERAGDRRILFSDEKISWADIDRARNVVDSLGRPAHGVLVLRNLASFAPSSWQQSLKGGNLKTLDEHLRKAFSEPDAVNLAPPFHRRDGRGLIERWVEVLGPENFTVVVLERKHPDRLLNTFERMLGLPAGMLVDAPVPAGGSNRGLSTAEAALLMALNRRVMVEWGADRREQRRLIFSGAAARLVGMRTLGPQEEKIRAPRWAVEAAVEAGGRLAETVRDSGARVIGDLSELTRMEPSNETDPTAMPEMLPSEVALEALSGMYAAATGWTWKHTRRLPDAASSRPAEKERRKPEPDVDAVLRSIPTKTLMATLARRARHRARRSLGRA